MTHSSQPQGLKQTERSKLPRSVNPECDDKHCTINPETLTVSGARPFAEFDKGEQQAQLAIVNCSHGATPPNQSM
jgi:hypothetical protein